MWKLLVLEAVPGAAMLGKIQELRTLELVAVLSLALLAIVGTDPGFGLPFKERLPLECDEDRFRVPFAEYCVVSWGVATKLVKVEVTVEVIVAIEG